MTNDGNGENPNGSALFEAANKLRGSVESAEYKHLVLGLIFLKYISDSFAVRRGQLEAELADPTSELSTDDAAEREEVLEDRDEYVAENVFWVPEDARWEKLLAAAQQPDIARRIDDALETIENENPRLRNVLPRVYSRAPLSAELMGSLVQTIAKIGFGTEARDARDILGRTYEYFIKEFARSEGHRGGEFFTPGPVARLLIEMLQPFQGRILDPACGSCGLFVQSGRFIESHGGNPDRISIYGQERNQATWRIGLMNLAIHGLSGDVQYTQGGSLLDDAFPSLKADFVMANPPFNQKEWSTPAVLDDARWTHGRPPAGNASDTEERITDLALDESSAKLLPINTVLVAMYGATVGQLGILGKEAACNQACCALIVDEAIADHRFVFYSLLHNRARLRNLASGAAQQNISGRTIKAFQIPCPPLPEQRRIASVLEALDAKVASRSRTRPRSWRPTRSRGSSRSPTPRSCGSSRWEVRSRGGPVPRLRRLTPASKTS
jgi:methylase of polypeptide subunit release factors